MASTCCLSPPTLLVSPSPRPCAHTSKGLLCPSSFYAGWRGPPRFVYATLPPGGPWGSPRQAWPAGWFWWWTGCGEATLLGSRCSGRMKSGSQSSPQGWSEPSPPQPWTRPLWGSSPLAVLSVGFLGSWSTVPAAIPGCLVKQRSMAGMGSGWCLVTSLAHGQEF